MGTLAAQAAQTFAVGQASSIDATLSGGSSAGSVGGAANGESFSTDYAMSLLARITHASADQALALIQSMSTPVGPTR